MNLGSVLNLIIILGVVTSFGYVLGWAFNIRDETMGKFALIIGLALMILISLVLIIFFELVIQNQP